MPEFADSAVAKCSVSTRETVREQEMRTISEHIGDTSDFGTMPEKVTIITSDGNRSSTRVQVS